MADKEAAHETYEIHGTIPEHEWMRFFKEHFKPSPPGHRPEDRAESRAATTGSCEGYGCPSKHPISGTKLEGCNVEIVHGKVVTVQCHYERVAR